MAKMTFEDYLRTYPTSVLIGNMMTVGEVLALYERIAKLEAMLQVTSKDIALYSFHLARQCPEFVDDWAADPAWVKSLNDMSCDEQAAWFKGVKPTEL